MSSKQVTDRQKNVASILAAADTHVVPAVAEIDKLLTPHLAPGETLPDVALLVALTKRLVARAGDDLVRADDAHEAELSDDAAPRLARDAAREALYATLTDLRDWLRGLFGEGALRGLGFYGDTPEDPVVLERFAGQVIDALQKPLPKLRRPGATWDASDTVTTLIAQRDALSQHIADVTREAREAQVTWSTRVTALDTLDDRFRRSVGLLEGVLRLGGQDALADRLRPPTRRGTQALTEPTPTEPEKKDGNG
ncbi:Hypothetical protein A7982_10577 [Minicystis rosea]|nr:Hypothetical protein A7982_10577 [Minicystis rosea]